MATDPAEAAHPPAPSDHQPPALRDLAERARGGVGLIVTGGFSPDRSGRLTPHGAQAGEHQLAKHDRITREAFGQGLPLLDLRLVCGEDDDFANPIEPFVQGGAKIAAAIAAHAGL